MTEKPLSKRMVDLAYGNHYNTDEWESMSKEVEALESRLSKALTTLCWCYGIHCNEWVDCHKGCAAFNIQPIYEGTLGGEE